LLEGVHVVTIRRFRGFEAATIVPAGRIVLVGEPGAGRSDLIEARDRVLSPDSTRGRLSSEFDFYGRDASRRAEVEGVPSKFW
jgi:recombinational DNA repair ATPase RecF